MKMTTGAGAEGMREEKDVQDPMRQPIKYADKSIRFKKEADFKFHKQCSFTMGSQRVLNDHGRC
jgi:hypothetical protein